METEKGSKTAVQVTDKPMTQMHRRILQNVREVLVKDMDPENILLKMASTEVFTDAHEEKIKAGLTRQDQCELLLHILRRRGDRAYGIFKKALGKDHPHLANEVLEAENEELSSELTRERINSASRNQTCSRCQNLGKEIKALKNGTETLQKEKDNMVTKIRNLDKQNDDLKEQIKISSREKTEFEVQRKQIQQELEKGNQDFLYLGEEINVLKNRMATLQEEKDNRETTIRNLNMQNDELKTKIKLQKEQIHQGLERLDAENRKNVKVGREKDNLKIENSRLQQELKRLTKKLEKLVNAEPDPSLSRSPAQFNELLMKCNGLEERISLLSSIFVPSKKDYYSPGVVHALNTLSSAKLVATRSSEGPGNARDIFDRKNIIICSGTKEEKDSWWCVDLGQDYLLAMTHYALRHGNKEGEKVLSNWKMEGSTDGIRFIEIKTYEKIDNPPRYRGSDEHAPGRWSVQHAPGKVGAFRFFRIFQTRRNSSSNYGIYLSGLELYGVLFKV